ncbi:MAG TPA: response regulator [Candidatus Polarisedimenticolia bacterium]|nr:response regulator [Candidatus Polarisedimenticolia bacterium]
MKKILLADDSITIQKVVELTFSEGDYQVVCVSNGTQALKKVAEIRPDVVLLDVIMPEKNGYEVCEQIKRSPATSGIPVLLLTGTFEPFDKRRADAAGANGHLTKPFESQVLVTKVEELIAATPTVISSQEAGAMEVISGGDLYHVGTGAAPGEGMRPMASPVPAGLTAPPSPVTAGMAVAPGTPTAATGSTTDTDEIPVPPMAHPALAPPDPAAGGSYVGFADLGLGAEEDGRIVPDRYDDDSRVPTSTMKLRRDAVVPPKGGDARAFVPDSERDPSSTGIDGFTSGFEMQNPEPFTADREHRSEPVSGAGAPDPEPEWVSPPEAPPAETWQSPEEEPVRPVAQGAPTSPAGVTGLTQETIELIAEKVVQRMSDRVVREIAWEVIPGVAEAIVRRRIKELEEKEPG